MIFAVDQNRDYWLIHFIRKQLTAYIYYHISYNHYPALKFWNNY